MVIEADKAPAGAEAEAAARIGARLDRLALTGAHQRLALIMAAGLVVDSVDIAVTASIGGALVEAGFADLNGVAALAMASAFGLGLGGLVVGALADRFGRVLMLRLNILVIIAGGFGAALSPSLEELLVWRALTALALGGETVLAYGMLTEFAPARARGRWLAFVALLASIGLPLSMAAGRFVLPLADGWRWMLAAPSLAGLGIFALRFWLDESPRWLAAKGRFDAAEPIVARLEREAERGRRPSAADAAANAPHRAADMARAGAQPERQAHPLWRRLAVAGTVHVAAMTAVFGFVSWLPTFFVASGRDVASSALFSAVMSAGAPAGAALALLLADRFERKWLVVAGAGAAASLGAVYALQSAAGPIMGVGCLTVVAIYFAATVGLMSYAPELFPTASRLAAIGFASALGRGAAFVLPMIVAGLFQAAGQGAVVAFVGAVLVLEAALVGAWGPRTSGRALEAL